MTSDGLDPNSLAFLERSLVLGRGVLFTGAGFSAGAKNKAGRALPTGAGLKALLWPLAFGDEPFDKSSSLGDVYDLALATNRTRARALLETELAVNRPAIPGFYRTFLEIPWARIYTLNFDDLLQGANSKFKLGLNLSDVSAVSEPVPVLDKYSQVFLNGRLEDFPNITFSPPQYGERLALTDTAYIDLVSMLNSHPVVFVGTQLEEPSLWQHMAMRSMSGRGGIRPRSFIVIPDMPLAKKALLSHYNIEHIPMTAEEFAELVLAPIAAQAPARGLYTGASGSPFDDLEAALKESVTDPADFLLGREPDWGDFGVSGFAITREFEGPLLQKALDGITRAILITGTAGSGKSTTIRRLALRLHSEGKKVAWLRAEAHHSVADIRKEAQESKAEVVVIDRADRFGDNGVEIALDVLSNPDGPMLVAAYGTNSFDELAIEKRLEDYAVHAEVVPNLTDADIELLLDALTAGSRLGVLAGLDRPAQVRAFRTRASRQLLVAMLEATSGQTFEEKIKAECDDLPDDLILPYAITSISTMQRYNIRREDLLSCISDTTPEGLDVLDRLERRHLLLKVKSNRLACRHAVVAREVFNHYRISGQLSSPIRRLGFVIAAGLWDGMPITPERRLVTRLVNHDYLKRSVSSKEQVREIYDELEPLLRTDAHYWLQRGSYELEKKNLERAELFLAQAKGLARPTDFMVATEWSYLTLARACSDPADSRSPSRFADGFEALLELIEEVGPKSVNTAVVLGQKTVEWCEVSGIDADEAKSLLQTVRTMFTAMSPHHSENRQFVLARDLVEKAYLSLAIPQRAD